MLATPPISTKGMGTPRLVQTSFARIQKLTMALQAEILNSLMIVEEEAPDDPF